MNDPFDDRWQALAARARQAPERPLEAPWGFAGRVVTRWRREAEPAASGWERFAATLLAGLACALVVLVAMEFTAMSGGHPLVPFSDDCTTPSFWQP